METIDDILHNIKIVHKRETDVEFAHDSILIGDVEIGYIIKGNKYSSKKWYFVSYTSKLPHYNTDSTLKQALLEVFCHIIKELTRHESNKK